MVREEEAIHFSLSLVRKSYFFVPHFSFSLLFLCASITRITSTSQHNSDNSDPPPPLSFFFFFLTLSLDRTLRPTLTLLQDSMQTSYNSGGAHHSAFSSALPSSLNDPTTTSSAHQRRSKPAPSLPQPHSNLSNRSSFMPWDDLEFPSPMENTGYVIFLDALGSSLLLRLGFMRAFFQLTQLSSPSYDKTRPRMKRTASYSSFLSKKSRPLYKPTLQHARALSGQLQ